MATQHNYRNSEKEELLPLDEVSRPSVEAGKKAGIALVGLGKYSEEQLGPALLETRHCRLAGIVTGTSSKIPAWQTKYDIPDANVYTYDNFDSIKGNKEIDIVYIVLPNALHAEFAIRAARAGKHVICEKPMAISVAECDQMIQACEEAGKLLSIGYRLHFEPHHKEMMKLGQNAGYGRLIELSAKHGSSSVEGWRLDGSLAGGGPLMDLGIYCIQAARYTIGMEPISITAKRGANTQPERFKNIEESLQWEMEFPGGIIARCETSYTSDMDLLHANATHGWFELSPAYGYSGIQGKTATGFMDLPPVNQQAAQMDNFAISVLDNKPVRVPGTLGRADLVIIEAIYEAMESGKKISIAAPFAADPKLT